MRGVQAREEASKHTVADTAIAALPAHHPALQKLGIAQIHTPQWQEHAFAPASLRPPEWEAARALDGAVWY